MNVQCVLCNGQTKTNGKDVIVTVNWVFKDILQKNNIRFDKPLPRIVKICKKCWDSIKIKPENDDYYWLFNKSL